jgi:hypothetical protein
MDVGDVVEFVAGTTGMNGLFRMCLIVCTFALLGAKIRIINTWCMLGENIS